MQRICASCSRPYNATRPNSKYCGDTCRKRAQRSPKSSPAPPVVPVPVVPAGLAAATERELADADRLGTMLGQTALVLARRIEDPSETGASIASMTKQLRETMADALKGAATAGDLLDELRNRRDAKRATG